MSLELAARNVERSNSVSRLRQPFSLPPGPATDFQYGGAARFAQPDVIMNEIEFDASQYFQQPRSAGASNEFLMLRSTGAKSSPQQVLRSRNFATWGEG